MARQAEAERERRAKVIAAEGELQASEKLAEAAAVIGREPAALQLRFLQTVGEIATENNSTTILPVPIDLFAPYVRQIVGGAGAAEGSATKSSSAEGRALLGAPPAIPGAPGTNLDPQRVEAAREKPQPR